MTALATRLAYFSCFLLLDGVAALDHRPPERHPVQEIVVGLDLGGFGTDAAADFDAGEEAQQEQGALDAAKLTESAVKPAAAAVCAQLAQEQGTA